MNVEDYPLVVLEDLENILQTIRKACKENPTVLRERQFRGNEIITVRSPQFKSFTFEVISVELKSPKSVIYKYHMNPWADTVNKKNSGSATSKYLIERFELWKSLIERYENLNFDDPIIEEYENEIFEYIKILDEDADSEPFNIEQQIAILQYLEKIDQTDKTDIDEEYAEAISYQIEEAKTELTRLPKNQVMKKVSRIMAIARKSSLNLFKSFFDIFKKDMMKKMLWSGLDKLEELFVLIKNLPL